MRSRTLRASSRAAGTGQDVDPALLRTFLQQYVAAGGEILDVERKAMPSLRRIRLLWETLYELGRACRGFAVDWDYLIGNLTALDGLAQERL